VLAGEPTWCYLCATWCYLCATWCYLCATWCYLRATWVQPGATCVQTCALHVAYASVMFSTGWRPRLCLCTIQWQLLYHVMDNSLCHKFDGITSHLSDGCAFTTPFWQCPCHSTAGASSKRRCLSGCLPCSCALSHGAWCCHAVC